jgi:formylglycine-generating enzyme required for sulfatase activity
MKKFSIYFIWLLAIVVIHSGPAISDETLNDVKNRIEKSLKRDLVGIAHVRGETYNVGNQKEHRFELLSFEVDKDGYLELHWNVLGRGKQPVINLSWKDAQGYVTWLRRETNKP